MACGVGTLFLGISRALDYMLRGQRWSLRGIHAGGHLSGTGRAVWGNPESGAAPGALRGMAEAEDRKRPTTGIRDRFSPASLTVCIGAMASLGRLRTELGGLVHSGGRGGSGSDHYHSDDLLPGEGMRVAIPVFPLGRRADPAGQGDPAPDSTDQAEAICLLSAMC